MLKIEKNIPVPSIPSHHKAKYPWREMEIGDSFFVASDGAKNRGASLLSIARRYRPRKFMTRTVDDGVRIWRIE